MWDAKLLRRKGKERHLFLFQQALLVTKEVKDVDGKVVYLYKYKLKVCNSNDFRKNYENYCFSYDNSFCSSIRSVRILG